jgi:oxygen-independent coproporphyrinogen III oxidase
MRKRSRPKSRLLKRDLAPGITLSRLHWGGGHPTLLSADLMRDLADTIFTVVPMGDGWRVLGRDRPERNRRSPPRCAGRAGMNRASIGVQDFDPLTSRKPSAANRAMN